MKKYAGLITALFATLLLIVIVVMPSVIEAQRRPTRDRNAKFNFTVQGQSNEVTVGQSMQNDTSPPLRDMKQKNVPKKEEKEGPSNPKVPASQKHKDKDDEAVQAPNNTLLASPNMPATSQNFDGIPFPGV